MKLQDEVGEGGWFFWESICSQWTNHFPADHQRLNEAHQLKLIWCFVKDAVLTERHIKGHWLLLLLLFSASENIWRHVLNTLWFRKVLFWLWAVRFLQNWTAPELQTFETQVPQNKHWKLSYLTTFELAGTSDHNICCQTQREKDICQVVGKSTSRLIFAERVVIFRSKTKCPENSNIPVTTVSHIQPKIQCSTSGPR